MIIRKNHCWKDNFRFGRTLSTTPGDGGWTIKDTSSGGTPTYAIQAGGGVKLLLANSSEEEVVTLYQNDVLGIPLVDVQRVEFIAKCGGFDANTIAVMGLASAQADDEDATDTNAWFKIIGGASTHSIVIETDDNTTNTDDKATGQTLTTTNKLFVIDFSYGLADVRFFIDGQRVGSANLMSLAAGTAKNVQPFFQIHKASGTGVGYIQIKDFELHFTTTTGG